MQFIGSPIFGNAKGASCMYLIASSYGMLTTPRGAHLAIHRDDTISGAKPSPWQPLTTHWHHGCASSNFTTSSRCSGGAARSAFSALSFSFLSFATCNGVRPQPQNRNAWQVKSQTWTRRGVMPQLSISNVLETNKASLECLRTKKGSDG